MEIWDRRSGGYLGSEELNRTTGGYRYLYCHLS